MFGSSLALTSGQTIAYLPDGIMDLDIVSTSSAGDFMVLFSDLSNDGAVTAVLVKVTIPTYLSVWHACSMFEAKKLCFSQLTQLTASAQLIRNSPNFLLSPANKDIGSVYTWGALAAGDLTPLRSQAAILFVDNNFNCSVSAEYVITSLLLLAVFMYCCSSIDICTIQES